VPLVVYSGHGSPPSVNFTATAAALNATTEASMPLRMLAFEPPFLRW
jgi:hypothetical protein